MQEKRISSRYNFGRSGHLVLLKELIPRSLHRHVIFEREFEDARPVRIRDLSGFEKMTFFFFIATLEYIF